MHAYWAPKHKRTDLSPSRSMQIRARVWRGGVQLVHLELSSWDAPFSPDLPEHGSLKPEACPNNFLQAFPITNAETRSFPALYRVF